MHLVGNVLYIWLPFLNTTERFHAFSMQCAVHRAAFSKNHRKDFMHLVGNVLYIELAFLNTTERFHAFSRQYAVHIVAFSKHHRKMSCIQQAICCTYSCLFYNTERFHAFSRQCAVHNIVTFSKHHRKSSCIQQAMCCTYSCLKDFMHLVGNVLYIQLPFLNTIETFHAFIRKCAVHIFTFSKNHRKISCIQQGNML